MNTFWTILQILGIYLLLTTVFYLFKFFTTRDLVRKLYVKRLGRTAIFIGIFIVLFFIFRLGSNTYGVSSNEMLNSSSMPESFSGTELSIAPYPNPYNGNSNGTINDTREFIKKSFSANIETREVEDVAKKTELLIKGNDGRIDSSNVSNKYAYFSFVIPKDKLNDFEDQLRMFTDAKLYTQSISSQNLLSEKQNLERNQDQNKKDILKIADQKNKIQSDYKSSSNSYRSQITNLENQITANQNSMSQTTDNNQKMALINKNDSLEVKRNELKNSLNQTTLNFKNQMSNLGFSLDEQTTILSNLDSQENQFFNNIETVQGSIIIEYISIWEMFKKLSPVDPIILIGIIVTIIKLLSVLNKDKNVSKIQTTSI